MAFESFPRISVVDFNPDADLVQVFNKKTGTVGVVNPSQIAPPSGAAGAIQFSNGTSFSSDVANLIWDNTNKRLGVGTNSPSAPLDVNGTADGVTAIRFKSQFSAFGTLWSDNTQVGICRNFRGTGGNACLSLGAVGVGVRTGGDHTAVATLDIKGSGSTSATTSLLVQNSSGTTQLYMRDDGVMVFANQVQGPLLRASSNLACSNFQTQNYAGLWMSVDDSVNVGNVTIGNGTTTLGAKLGIKGAGSTSATTSLLVQNSSAQTKFFVDDSSVGASVAIGNLINGYSSLYWPANSVGIGLISGGGIGAKLSNTASFVISDSSTPTNETSAKLIVNSTNAGFMPPRMTTAQRNAIASPANSLIVFDTDLQNLCYRRDGVWVQATFSAA